LVFLEDFLVGLTTGASSSVVPSATSSGAATVSPISATFTFAGTTF